MSGAFAGRKVVVIGAGVAGTAAARALVGEGGDVTITEARPADRIEGLAALRALGVEVVAGGHNESQLEGATLVVPSPGVRPDAPIIMRAQELAIPIWGELELGARLCTVPFIAVTGTNGKTTTTGMIASCLQAAGLDAVACGNIGHPFTVAAIEDHDVLVVEASSFQLRFVETFHPRVSALLNLSPDHLDWHGSEDAYAAAKATIFLAQTGEDVHVGNRDDERSAAVSTRAPAQLVWFRLGEPDLGEVGYLDGELVTRMDGESSIVGPVDGERAGYRADAAAATAAALAFGVDAEAVRRGLASYIPAHHRGELVALVDGVRFIDNSKATNVHAALAAIDGVASAVLIAGGRAKGVDLSPLATRSDRLQGVVAIGESADALVRIFEASVPVRRAGSIEDATRAALDLVRPPGVVLLAPACASWDMFEDYEERGDRFAAAARELMEEVGAHG